MVERAKAWFYSNHLTINVEYTQNLLWTPKSRLLKEEAARLLGLWVDRKLSWNQHIAKVRVKTPILQYLLGNLGSASLDHSRFPYITNSCRAMYVTIILGHSSAAWDCMLLHKRALCNITLTGNRDKQVNLLVFDSVSPTSSATDVDNKVYKSHLQNAYCLIYLRHKNGTSKSIIHVV